MRVARHCFVWLCCFVFAVDAAAQSPAQYRGYWVDTFNTSMNNLAQVQDVVARAKASNANALFAQIRRRGDAWYLDSLEPAPWDATFAPGFDALQTLITLAHAEGIEVHAYVIVGAIWNRHPTILPMPVPQHMFSRHGFNTTTGQIYTGRDNWLTRTLLPDSTPGAGITFQGHRIGSDFWIDLGHPDAADETVNVLMHLVRNYDVDGLHLDRIRYPEFTVSGQTPSTGANIGYNATNVARFNARFGTTGNPAPGNPQWMQWRRDQVTNFVRRVYLNAIAIKPNIKLSASLIAFGGVTNPTNENSWNSAEAYWRVYQDWRAWTEEGILDIAIPMNYKREHFTSNINLYTQWNEWTKNHAYNRMTLIGQGAFLNSIEGTLKQVRKAFTPSSLGNSTSGIVFFSMATSNVAVTASSSNISGTPLTPLRSFAEFASGLTTGRSVNGAVNYEDPLLNPVPVFQSTASIPDMPWKSAPRVGHVKGTVRDENGNIVDAGSVMLQRIAGGIVTAGRTLINTQSDGSGFYGGVDLAPGQYTLSVTPTARPAFSSACTFQINAGQVTDFNVTIDAQAPTLAASLDQPNLWAPNNQMVDITLNGAAMDTGTGIASVTFEVVDEYGEVQPEIAPESATGAASLTFTRTFRLLSSRLGQDKDGRTYTITIRVTDVACNTTTQTLTVRVAHDRRDSN
ncbi:MAG TPA: family 10 glycosylhydrolase [Terriglobales bacterium]|nr:family 10 glycosylhydrolase [Terriglobales bacterium]